MNKTTRKINKYLYSTVYDVLKNVLHREPTMDLIMSSIDILPKPIMNLGNEWGHNDPVFKETAHDFIQRKVMDGKMKFGKIYK